MNQLPSGAHLETIKHAVDMTQDAIGIYDADDVLTFCNRAYANLFDCEESPIGSTFDELITKCYQYKRGVNVETDDISAWLAMAATKRRKRPFRSFEVDLVDGRWFKLTELIIDDQLFVYATDITVSKKTELELLETKEKLTQAASTDFLTGIYNRRHFSQMTKIEIERCERNQLHTSLVLIDIDFFKRINDSYGHAAGDNILCQVTQRIRNCLRGYDIFARIGGEEFAILLPETLSSHAYKIAERYRKEIANAAFEFEGKNIEVTVSIGISESYPETKTLDYLLKSADENLYIAKQTGRNKVVSPALTDGL